MARDGKTVAGINTGGSMKTLRSSEMEAEAPPTL
jgi:hypothetical protein